MRGGWQLALVVFIMAASVAGCGDGNTPSAPTAPPASASPPATQPAPPTGPQPAIRRVSPDVVSTTGTWGCVTGAQFEPGAVVKFGDAVSTGYLRDSTELCFTNSPPHSVGTVDVTVANPGGFSATLRAGYTYVNPDQFDLNGEWSGHANEREDYGIDMRFTIRNNVLISLSCGSSGPTNVAVPVQIADGNFSLEGGGLKLSGTMASTETTYGRVSIPGCVDFGWWGAKVSDANVLRAHMNREALR